jgi:hypothetical protein
VHISARPILIRQESSAKHGRNAQDGEESRSDSCRGDRFGSGVAQQIYMPFQISSQVQKREVSRPKIIQVGQRDIPYQRMRLFGHSAKPDELARVCRGKWLEEHGPHETEDRSGSADSQGEGEALPR